jgi:hypothetical protein
MDDEFAARLAQVVSTPNADMDEFSDKTCSEA